MSNQPVLRATRTAPGRAPQQTELNRVCAATGCETRLSRYNKRQFCYSHWPTVLPVQRGVEKKIAA